jgi:hypothetical protein
LRYPDRPSQLFLKIFIVIELYHHYCYFFLKYISAFVAVVLAYKFIDLFRRDDYGS